MANFLKYIQTLAEFEGGFVNHPDDPGGATNKGITIGTWIRFGVDNDGDGDVDVADLQLMTKSQAHEIYKSRYWDKIWADHINSQEVANIVFDHAVNAGPWRAIKMAQWLLNRDFGQKLAIDGVMGPDTLGAINKVNAALFHNQYKDLRAKYYSYHAGSAAYEAELISFFRNELEVYPSSSARSFINGWLNRVNSFTDLVIKEVKKKDNTDCSCGCICCCSGNFHNN